MLEKHKKLNVDITVCPVCNCSSHHIVALRSTKFTIRHELKKPSFHVKYVCSTKKTQATQVRLKQIRKLHIDMIYKSSDQLVTLHSVYVCKKSYRMHKCNSCIVLPNDSIPFPNNYYTEAVSCPKMSSNYLDWLRQSDEPVGSPSTWAQGSYARRPKKKFKAFQGLFI